MLETRLTRERLERHRRSGAWRGTTLGELVAAHAARRGGATAIVDHRGTLDYAELLAHSELVARGLLAIGVRHGDVVGVQLPNWREFAIAALGIERIGAVVNPLATILRERELRQMLALGEARALFVADRFRGFDHATLGLRLRDELEHLTQVVVVGPAVPSGAVAWNDLVSSHAARTPPAVLQYLAPSGNDIAELAFTSGTTGQPKGAMHTHDSAVCTVGSTIRRQRFGPEDIFHVANPLGHNAGYFFGLRFGLQSGGTVVLQERWDPAEAVELIREHRATYSAGATTHLIDLLGTSTATREALSSLRMYICSGADVPRQVARAGVDLLPQAFTRVFGMTEIGHTTSTDTASPVVKRIETDGSPQPEMAVRVVDDEGVPLPAGEEGNIEVRGPFVCSGYVQGRDFSAPWFTGDWFRTGDLGRLDGDGFLTLVGRAKDVIVRGGEKVPSREIEELLSSHPAVSEVVLVPVADERLGERAVACLRVRGGAAVDLAAITEYLAEHRVTTQFWPEQVVVVDDFPRTPSGKIQKGVMRRRLESETDG